MEPRARYHHFLLPPTCNTNANINFCWFLFQYQCQYQYLLAIALQYQCQFQYLFSALCNINIGWHWQHFAISIFASYIVNLHPPTPQYQKPHPLRICDLVHLCRKSIPPYIFLPSSKCWWVDGTIRSQD